MPYTLYNRWFGLFKTYFLKKITYIQIMNYLKYNIHIIETSLKNIVIKIREFISNTSTKSPQHQAKPISRCKEKSMLIYNSSR